MQSLNLIPRSFQIRRNRRRRVRAWLFGLGVYVVAAGLGSLIASVMSAGPQGATADLVTEAEAQASNAKRDIARATRDAAEWSRRADAERAIGEHPRWSALLGLLASLRGDAVVLSTIELQAPAAPGSGYRLMIDGVARSQPAVTRYVLDLEGSGVFDKVTLAEIRAAEFRGEQASGFRAECVLGQTPGKTGGAR